MLMNLIYYLQSLFLLLHQMYTLKGNTLTVNLFQSYGQWTSMVHMKETLPGCELDPLCQQRCSRKFRDELSVPTRLNKNKIITSLVAGKRKYHRYSVSTNLQCSCSFKLNKAQHTAKIMCNQWMVSNHQQRLVLKCYLEVCMDGTINFKI